MQTGVIVARPRSSLHRAHEDPHPTLRRSAEPVVTAIAVPAPRARSARGLRLVGAGAAVVVALVLLAAAAVQRIEAATATALMRLVGLDAWSDASIVRIIVDTDPEKAGLPSGGYRLGGFTIAPSCSVALFLAPLLIAAAALLVGRRARAADVVRGLLVVIPLIIVVSQIRYVVTGALIAAQGQDRGFSLAHVLIGSIISTVGLVGGLVLFLWLVLGAPRRRGSGSTPHPVPNPINE